MTDKEIFKIGMLLGSVTSQLSNVQAQSSIDRSKWAELFVFNDTKPSEVSDIDCNIDV